MTIRVHELKISKEYADSVYFGDKTFEVRLNDRGFQKGDIVRFKPLGESSPFIDIRHPLYDKEYEITYVLGSFHGLAQGYVAFGIKPLPVRTEREGEWQEGLKRVRLQNFLVC